MTRSPSSAATLLVLLCLVGVAAPLRAQDIALSGTVKDATDAVLPGVTVTALHLDSGNIFVGVTDASGSYLIGSMRPGEYKVTAELPGFTIVTQERFALLVGQRGALNFTMTLSSIQESVTVTSEAPLIDTTQSRLGGNVDVRQVESLPLFGRNWTQLTMIAPGSRQNAVDESPFGSLPGASFQLNVDGQQATGTQSYTGFSPQPRFSRDAIGEFQLVSSRFDATQGRSMGVQVNAVTKAGTNSLSGSFGGYFRDDALNGEDFIAHRVLPYSNQQLVGTFGGPIARDKAHFFGYVEYEREPKSVIFNTPWTGFNVTIPTISKQKLAGGRVDVQLSTNTRFMIRGNTWLSNEPIEVSSARISGGSNHPASLTSKDFTTGQVFGSLTYARGHVVNDLRAGVNTMNGDWDRYLRGDYPTINFRGFSIGTGFFGAQHQKTYAVSDNLTIARSAHVLKLGGEFLLPDNFLYWASNIYGNIIADLGPAPANLDQLFPDWTDPSTWNIAALSPLTRRYRQAVGNFNVYRKKPQTGAYFQDDWRATSKLTLNLGLRWDFALDPLSNEVTYAPFRYPASNEWDWFQPRLGFAYTFRERTVFRGGWGKYYSGVADGMNHPTQVSLNTAIPELFNDGRPNFAADPWNIAGGGQVPTLEEARTRRNEITSQLLADTTRMPYSYQTSIGLQRQIGNALSVSADYVDILGLNQEDPARNTNLTFDPSTGVNYRFTNIATRRYPDWGAVPMRYLNGRNHYQALETSVQKRFGNRWQASGTYTLGRYRDLFAKPPDIPITLVPDLGDEYTLGAYRILGSTGFDQRHRMTVNAISDLPYGIQLSGLYFFASGQRFETSYGGDLRDTGGVSSRLRPDGTIVPRNNFVGRPLHRVDVRMQKRLSLGSGVHIDGIAEVFNAFNHANYGAYITDESNRLYGQPVQNLNVAYQPRMMQLGFRVSF
jgi:hypothetical protein